MYTIVAVLGDYYHQAEVIRAAFQEAVSSVFGGEDAVQVREVDAAGLPQALADRPDAVVLFKENRTDPEGDKQAGWMTEAVEEAIEAYVREGGGLSWCCGAGESKSQGRLG
ncbi:hypothetical protein WMW72_01785 [Paenibacillus filicis]|uniref:Uncharacterized protein n=1 Tax=Paenibacillus filicis TaxID=669464 RepID=A0ABU9DF21_9BACL